MNIYTLRFEGKCKQDEIEGSAIVIAFSEEEARRELVNKLMNKNIYVKKIFISTKDKYYAI